jgi:glutamate-ammonia-ligase adenylyltransferase
LRTPGTLAALDVLAAGGIWSAERCAALRTAYLFLRRLEHRLQMLNDAQCHALPLDAWTRERIAHGLGHAHWSTLAVALEHHRACVAEHFDRALPLAAEPTRGASAVAALPIDPIAGAATGSSVQSLAPALRERLDAFLQSGLVQGLGATERDRLERALPGLLQAAATSSAAELCLPRLLDFVQAVARRSAYLALLAEQPRVAEALAQLFARSAYLARLLTQMPLLLDELLDARRLELPFDPEPIGAELAEQIERAADSELALERLRECQRAWQLRAAVQFLDGRMDAVATTRALALLAEHVVAAALRLAERDLRAQHGLPSARRGGFLVLGYGSLGGRELNFASDLDLVFVYAPSREGGGSSGPKVLDNHRYFVRLAQRLTHLLTTTSVAGPLYEIDTRLRPNGRKGLLITSLRAYTDYQRRHAWTWEHQALVRARPIAGDAELARRFRRIRHALLTQPRPAERVDADVRAMRQRMRAELDRSTAECFDLKQGPGGLVDIEFWLQDYALRRGPGPELPSSTPELIEAAVRSGVLPADRAMLVRDAHRRWLELGLNATLALQPRVLTLAAEDRRLAEAVAQWTGFAAP